MATTAFLRSRTTSPSPPPNKNREKTSRMTRLSGSVSPSVSRKKLTYRQENDYFTPVSPTTTNDMNRVHEELEKLNIATDVINKLELQLDEARATFREIQSGWTQKLEQLTKKLGSCIEKSRPYYEARMKVLEAQQDAQRAALRFERANSLHAVAKQQVALTQESLNQGTRDVDPACLEVLNHHIQRVNEAERERLQSEDEHKRVSCRVAEVNRQVITMEKELKRSIQKSKPYYEARVEFTKVLEDQKALIQRLETEIKQKKQDYNTSLRNLERISEQIHERRQALGRRDPGVGSEHPDPPRRDSANAESKAAETEPAFTNRKVSVESTSSQQTDNSDKTVIHQQPVVFMRRHSKHTARVEDLMEILGAKAVSKSNGSDELRRRAESVPAEQHRRTRLNSGVILLAQQLLASSQKDAYERDIDRKTRAFTFPPEQLDLQYKTIPEGVKPFPTPPETPTDSKAPISSSTTPQTAPRRGSDPTFYENRSKDLTPSESSSLSSFAYDDVERIVGRSPDGLIREIDHVFERANMTSDEQSEEENLKVSTSRNGH